MTRESVAVAFMGVTAARLGALVVLRSGGIVTAGLVAATVLVNIGRALFIQAYRRQRPVVQTEQAAKP